MTVQLGMTVLMYVGGALAVVFASWLLALIVKDLVEQLEAIDDRVEGSVQKRARGFLGRFSRLSDAVRRDAHVIRPSELLSSLVRASKESGDAIVHGLVQSQVLLEANLQRIGALGEEVAQLSREASRRAKAASGSEGTDEAEGAEPEAGNAFWTFVFLLITPAVVVVNTAILMEFFGEFFASGSVLPYPLPEVGLGDVIAVLFSLVEIIAGLLIHGSRTKTDLVGRLFNLVPAIVIFALCFIEIVAYSVLSYNVAMGDTLGLTGFLGAVVNYFLAPFGAALPLLLARLGYELGERMSALLKARAAMRTGLRLDQWQEALDKALKEASDGIEEWNGRVDSQLPVRIPEHGAHQGDLEYVEGLATALQVSPGDEEHPSHAQAWAAVAFDFLLSVALVFFAFAAYQYGAYQFGEVLPVGQQNLATTLAIVLAVVVAVVAFVLKEKLSRRMWVGVGLVSVVRTGHLMLFGIEAVAVLLYGLIGAAILFMSFLLLQLLQLASVPGKVIRDSRRPRGRK